MALQNIEVTASAYAYPLLMDPPIDLELLRLRSLLVAIESLKGAGVSVTDLQKVMEGLYGDSMLQGTHDGAAAAGGNTASSSFMMTGWNASFWPSSAEILPSAAASRFPNAASSSATVGSSSSDSGE